MSRQKFNLVAKILYLGTLEEAFSIEKASVLSSVRTEDLLEEIHKVLKKKKTQSKLRVNLTTGVFKFKERTDVSAWREFRLNCEESNYFPILYKWVGGFSDQEVQKTLGIGEGALFSRYNKGLLKLGEYLMKGRVKL